MARAFAGFLVFVVSTAVAAGAAGCAASSPASEDPRAFFAGKTLTYIVATEAGGGYDAYGRLVSQYIGKRLGVRNVVVKNIPGGGHIVGVQPNGSATRRNRHTLRVALGCRRNQRRTRLRLGLVGLCHGRNCPP